MPRGWGKKRKKKKKEKKRKKKRKGGTIRIRAEETSRLSAKPNTSLFLKKIRRTQSVH
jgi:hypothetical protein